MELDTAKIYARIQPYIRRTPLIYSQYYSALLWAKVYLKCENLQYTNSFKVRGAFNTLLSLSDEEKKSAKVVTTSGWNHGIAVAYAGQTCWIPVTVYVPATTSQYKKNKIMSYWAHLQTFDEPRHIANQTVMEDAQKQGTLYIHPFSQMSIIAWQSTIAYEILEELPETTKIICSIWWGGLISWISRYAKTSNSNIQIYGVETLWADSMNQALAANEPVSLPGISSICDSLGATKVSELTLGIVKDTVDHCSTVTDTEALEDLKTVLAEEKLLIEPASSCCLSALRIGNIPNISPTDTIVIVLCWGNISNEQLKARI